MSLVNLEYIIKLRNQLTPGLNAAASAADSAGNRIANDMHKVERASHAASGGVSRLRSTIVGLIAVAAPFIGAFASFEFMKGSVEEFNNQAQAQAQLVASLKSTGNAAGLTAKQLSDQAEALQKVTLYGDETTERMQSLLLTFTNIRGQVFTDTIPLIQDMATKMGVDLKDSAIQVGKALNDPIQGITALKRVGVSFTDAQRDVIKNLVLTGHTADAQRIILHELANEFGGSAAAAAAAGTGPFQQLALKFGDVREKIGEAAVKLGTMFLPMLNKFVDLVDKGVDRLHDLYGWLKDHKELLGGLAVTVGIAATAWGVYNTVTAVASLRTLTLSKVTGWLNLKLLANPAVLITIAIIGLIAVISLLIYAFDGWGKQWDSLMNFSKHVWNGFKAHFELTWLKLQDTFLSGIELIEKNWYRVKSLWDEEGAAAGLSKLNNEQGQRAAEIARMKGVLESEQKMARESLKWEIHRNDKTLGTVVTDLKKKLGITSPGKVSPTDIAGGAAGGSLGGGLGDGSAGKSSADSINAGGQRSIVINIGKQIEKLEMHVMDAKEGVNEIETAVREVMRRVIYSMNGVAS